MTSYVQKSLFWNKTEKIQFRVRSYLPDPIQAMQI